MSRAEPLKAPDRLLHVADLSFLTGEARATIVARLKDADGPWAGEARVLGNKLALPLTVYNRWVDEIRLRRAPNA